MTYLLKPNPVKKAINDGKTSFGLYVATPSPIIVELAGLAGLDWVRIDWCHSPLDLIMIENMVSAAECHNMAPFIPIENNEQKIASVLEMGIMGIIVPDVSTVEDAKAVVNAAKFSPIGNRGMFSCPRKSGYGTIDSASFKEWSNEEVIVAIQIESSEAIENLEEILNVPGIDMVLSGRGDLSNSLGVPGQKTHSLVLEAEERIFQLAKSKGIAISPQLDPAAPNISSTVQEWIEKGANVISFGHDLLVIRKAFESIIKNARGAT